MNSHQRAQRDRANHCLFWWHHRGFPASNPTTPVTQSAYSRLRQIASALGAHRLHLSIPAPIAVGVEFDRDDVAPSVEELGEIRALVLVPLATD